MNENPRMRVLTALLAMAFTATFFYSASALLRAQARSPKAKIFAQKLVESTQAKHPETDEVSISAMTARGCAEIASTDKSDIGQKCEKEDVEPMRTGKAYVEKEKDGFDVSLPLHDTTAKIIGTVGVGFKPSAGQSEASVTQLAQKIATEMAAQIPSKERLFEHVQE